MNYLGHLYLSGNDPEIIVGNFIGDAVKGNNLERFPAKVEKGIRLHRHIDYTTDKHSSVKEIIDLFRDDYGKYSGVVTDLVFDHILARYWPQYCNEPLSCYIDRINGILLDYFFLMPLKVQCMLPYWVKHRWPEIYSTREGLIRALNGMSKYTSLPVISHSLLDVLDNNEVKIKENFTLFILEFRQRVFT